MNRALLKKAAQVAKFDPKMAYEMVEKAARGEEWYKEDELDRTFGALNRAFIDGLLKPLKEMGHETDASRLRSGLAGLTHKAEEVNKLLGVLSQILPV